MKILIVKTACQMYYKLTYCCVSHDENMKNVSQIIS